MTTRESIAWAWLFAGALCAACHRPLPLPAIERPTDEAQEARELTRAGRPLEAFERLETIVRQRPGQLAAHRWYVEAAAECGRLAEVEAYYRGQQQGETAPLASYGLGLVEAARGRLEPALEYLRQAMEAFPQEPEPPYRLGLLYLLNSQNEAAVEALRQALARDQSHCDSRVALAEALARLSRRAEAVEALRPLIEQECPSRVMDRARTVSARLFDPLRAAEPDAAPDLTRAMDLLGQDLVQQTLSLTDKILERFPRDSLALTLRGLAQSRLENYAEAVSAFEEALQIQPDNISALMGLGDIYFRLERWEKARGYYEQAAVKSPLDAQACQRLGDLAGAQKNHALAARWYGRMVKLAPEDLALRHQYALSLFQADSYPQAIAVYEGILQTKPDDLESLVRLGSLYSALSRTQPGQREQFIEKAIRYLEEAKRLAPENQAVQEMLKKIEEGK